MPSFVRGAVLVATALLVAPARAGAVDSDVTAGAPPVPLHPTSRFVVSNPEYPTAMLRPHRASTRTLRGADVHRYALRMRRGEFAAVRVEQRAGNLAIVAFDPGGSPVAIVDENGAGHAEIVTLDAVRDGVYTLQVAMYEWDSPDARYAIEWHVRERTQATPPARGPRIRVEAVHRLCRRDAGVRRRVPIAGDAAPSYARSYPDARVVTGERMITIGSSGLECSVHDLRRWLANYAGDSLGGEAVRALVDAGRARPEPDAPSYAFGRWFAKRDGVESAGHQGLAAGFRTSVRSFPARDLAMIYLANDGNDATYGRIARLERLFLGIAEPPMEIPTGDYVPARDAPVSLDVIAASAGAYASDEADVRVDVRAREGGLVLVHPAFGTVPLLPQDTDAYTTPLEFLPRIEFVRDAQARAVGFDVVGEDVGRLRFTRLP